MKKTMKQQKIKKTAIIWLVIISITILSSCSSLKALISNVDEPNKNSTADEIYPAQNANATEKSSNVNGMRYTITLDEFTEKYNEIIEKTGNSEYLNKENWQKAGEPEQDLNGVKYQNYYYNANKFNFTAAVETESKKLINVGCGTTMSIFVLHENNESFSNIILKKSAIMAAAVCGFPTNSLDILQDIFYRTTFENKESLWYEGNIFSLSMNEDKNDSEKSTMLFRVFPVADYLLEKWNIPDYLSYIETMSQTNEFVTENNGKQQ